MTRPRQNVLMAVAVLVLSLGLWRWYRQPRMGAAWDFDEPGWMRFVDNDAHVGWYVPGNVVPVARPGSDWSGYSMVDSSALGCLRTFMYLGNFPNLGERRFTLRDSVVGGCHVKVSPIIASDTTHLEMLVHFEGNHFAEFAHLSCDAT